MIKFNRAIKFCRAYVGELMSVLGAGVLTYNIFNFSHQGGSGGEYTRGAVNSGVLVPWGGRYEFEYVAYYYADGTLFLIALGTMLLLSGILIIRKRS